MPPNRLISLTATADDGSNFRGWSGACSSVGACSLTVDEPKSVTATFAVGPAETRRITVSPSGTNGLGSGRVTSDPPGISCGTTCTGTFPLNTVITLTAAADSGSVFRGWGSICYVSGGGEGGPSIGGSTPTNTCRIVLDADKNVDANFAQQTFSLTVSPRSGGGAGSLSVVSDPIGIVCGSSCAARYAAGTLVTLTATPSAGADFAGWGGACSGTARTCEVLMNANQSVDAYYASATVPPPVCRDASVTVVALGASGPMTNVAIQGVVNLPLISVSSVVIPNVPRGVYTLTIVGGRGTQSQTINVGCGTNLVVFR